jgi:hydrogenase maturation protease
MTKKKSRLVVLVCGNPSRGDDALGPELARWFETHYANRHDIELIEDFQLQIEHALDLEDRDLALFIDASVSCSPPLSFTRLYPTQDVTYSSHALHPSAVLQVYQNIKKQSPPPSFLLAIRGEQFELGEPLSVAATHHLLTAIKYVEKLCDRIEATTWESYVTDEEHH